MRKYNFEDFSIDRDNKTIIQNSAAIGTKIWISIFNPVVPNVWKEKALEKLNHFIEENKDVIFHKSDTVGAVLETCISSEVDKDEKYKLLLFIWNESERYKKEYFVEIPILPIEEYFLGFKQCFMQELEHIMF